MLSRNDEAFSCIRLMSGFGWANNPVLPRLKHLDKNGKTRDCIHYILILSILVQMKVLYGSKSWMTHLQVNDFIENGVEAAVTVDYIEEAGHHIYADQYHNFNDAVNQCLKTFD